MRNAVFIGTSLDGYIADKGGGLDYLHCVPNPGQDDLGYLAFIDRIDALLIGIMTAYLTSFIGSLLGDYVGVRINQNYL